MAKRITLKRDVTREECDWLDRDFKKGEEVYLFYGATYGCISGDGKACTLSASGETPFFEIPNDAIEE